MDPNLFHLDYEKLFEVLITILTLSILFESRFFIERTESGELLAKMKKSRGEKVDDQIVKRKKRSGIRELISFIVAVVFF